MDKALAGDLATTTGSAHLRYTTEKSPFDTQVEGASGSNRRQLPIGPLCGQAGEREMHIRLKEGKQAFNAVNRLNS